MAFFSHLFGRWINFLDGGGGSRDVHVRGRQGLTR
jgi:hypothetical protein